MISSKSSPEWYGALDLGTTSIIFILFDLSGPRPVRLVKAKRVIPTISQHPGWAEQDPSLLLKSTIECIDEISEWADARHGFPALKYCVRSVGITNQRETVVAWDAKTGEPISPAILWLDTRTKDLLEEISYMPEHRLKTGLPLSTYFSGPKIRWMLENIAEVEPEKHELRFGTLDSWIMLKLLKGSPHLTDVTNAGRTLMLDINTLKWDQGLCHLFKCKAEWLATQILPNAAPFGEFNDVSMASGIPLTASLGDQHAALLGHGCDSGDCTKLTYGTGCFLLRPVSIEAINDSINFDALLRTIGFHLNADKPPIYAVEAPVSAGGSCFSWLRDHLQILSDPDQIDHLIKLPNPNESVEDAVYFLPALSGILAPYWKPEARASIHGLSLHSGRNENILAVVESIAFACRQVIELAGQKDISKLRLDGGLTNVKTLMSIQATVLNNSLYISEESQATALGAAIAAYRGHNGKPYVRGPISLRIVEPVPTLVEYYERKYHRWLFLMNNNFLVL